MRKEWISLGINSKYKESIKKFQRKRGLNRNQAITHILRIGFMALDDKEWIRKNGIDQLPLGEVERSDDVLDDLFGQQ